MLDIITKSKIRQRIILLFFYNPDESYYINQVAKLVKTSAGTARRELEKLQKNSILSRIRRGNSVYFGLNLENPLLSDLKDIVDKTLGIEYQLKKQLADLSRIDFAFLFGSYVKGNFRHDSDIDLYVIGDISEADMHKKVKKSEDSIYQTINYHLCDRQEFRRNLKKSFFHKDILGNYKLIIGDENEFREFIK